jgi:hypothetical protein
LIARYLLSAVVPYLIGVAHAQIMPLFPPWFWLVTEPIEVFEQCSIHGELRADIERKSTLFQRKLAGLIAPEDLEQITTVQRKRIAEIRASKGQTPDIGDCHQAMERMDVDRIRFAVAELKADEFNDREIGRRIEYWGNRQPNQMPRLGIKLVVDKDQHQKIVNGVSRQAIVAEVILESPASTAGIRPGDQITAVGNTSIARPSDLIAAILTLSPGTPYRIEVVREARGVLILEVTPAYTREGDELSYGVY